MTTNYQEFATLPAFVQAQWTDGMVSNAAEGVVLWGGKGVEPPAIGTEIMATMNGLGAATVAGYFVERGFLGLLVAFKNPPEWYVKQNRGNPPGHLFGPEFKLA